MNNNSNNFQFVILEYSKCSFVYDCKDFVKIIQIVELCPFWEWNK